MPRRILIIGASSTLGFATARALSSDDILLWLTYRSPEKELALHSTFPGARLSRVDLLNLADIDELTQQIRSSWNGLDALIVSSGKGLLQPAAVTQAPAVAEVIQVNLSSIIYLLTRTYSLLSRGSNPAVVLVSSIMALAGAAGMSTYSATKGAITTLTRSLAIEWAARRIRVNAVAPGIIPSPLVSEMFSLLSPAQVENIRSRHPFGFGEPEDVAHAVRFLISPEAKWITGAVLPVDGGYTAQ